MIKAFFSKIKFKSQLGSFLLIGITICSILYYFSEKANRTQISRKFFLEKSRSVFESVRLGFEVGLNNENFKSINAVFDWAKSQDNLKWIVITDAEGQTFATYPPQYKISPKQLKNKLKNNSLQQDLFLKNGSWKTKNDHGNIFIAFKTFRLINEEKNILKEVGLTVLTVMILSIIFTTIFSFSISSPLKSLYQVTSDIIDGEYHTRVNEVGGSLEISSVSRSFNKMMDQLILEQKKSDHLLLNILPLKIANRLKHEKGTIADNYYNCSVLFADIVGFTPLSASLSASELVGILNTIFSSIDDLAERFDLEKIKTIGDCYMVAGGLLEKTENHVHNICHMGLEIVEEINKINKQENLTLQVRVGIHVGPATAGVIGKKKFIYDLWGDSVNTASRMESHGMAGMVHVSEDIYNLVKNEFNFEKRQPMQIKGKGEMQTYFLKKNS